MQQLDAVNEMLKDAYGRAEAQKLSPEAEAYQLASVEALCEQFAGACYALAGGDPDLLTTIYEEHHGKALAVISMLVEVVNKLPEGGVSTRDLWDRVMRVIDEG